MALDVRIGLHSGEIEIIGDDIGGLAVHIAAHVVGSGIASEPRGTHTLKGVPDEWEIMAVSA